MGRPPSFCAFSLKEISPSRLIISPLLKIGNKIFDIKDKKSKDYYSPLVSKKAQPLNVICKLKSDFNFTIQQFKKSSRYHIWLHLSHNYVKAFQYKIINSILYTNSKLCKIGFRVDDECTFCNDEPENLYHLVYECPHSNTFWTDFKSYCYHLSNQPVHHSTQNVLFGVLSKHSPLSNLLNYFIIIGKLFLSECRRSQTLPKIQGLQSKLKIKYMYETKKNNKKTTSLKRNGYSLQYSYLLPSCFIAFLF